MNEAQQKARATYNAAADTFDHPANAYWERYGTKTVERLDLSPGAHVLDVACGTGASALPAAAIVGPSGHVIGVDLSEKMLVHGRKKAVMRGLRNVDFHHSDMAELDDAKATFDAVVCVFGIFFVPDMEAQIRKLWRMLKPGGKLAITTWGPDLFEPMSSHFKAAIARERPDLIPTYRPWQRLTVPSGVEALLLDGGAENVATASEEGEQELYDLEAWWNIVLGSGLRATVEAMKPQLAAQVRHQNQATIIEEGIGAVTTNVIYGVAQKAV
ncbi:class I SAM-dependent methyltransferase [Chloroflexi bacterium TSY]|nr:class I SAM-dependent methyltransferase [Chloroflexi bacterium TSY]